MAALFLDSINKMKSQYKALYWFQKIFIPRKLEDAINSLPVNPSRSDLFAFHDSYAKNSIWVPNWFFSTFITSLNTLTSTLIPLLETLEEQDSGLVINQADYPGIMRNAIVKLRTLELWKNNSIKQAIVNSPRQESLANSFIQLSADNDLLIKSIDTLSKAKDPVTTAEYLKLISDKTLLLKDDFADNANKIVDLSRDHQALIRTAINADLLTNEQAQSNFDTIIAHKTPRELDAVINSLIIKGREPQHFEKRVANNSPFYPPMDEALKKLAQDLDSLTVNWGLSKDLKQQNFEKLANYPFCSQIEDALKEIEEITLYPEQVKFDLFVSVNEVLCEITRVLLILNKAGLFNNNTDEGKATWTAMTDGSTFSNNSHGMDTLVKHGLLNNPNFAAMCKLVRDFYTEISFNFSIVLGQLKQLTQTEFDSFVKFHKKIFSARVYPLQSELIHYINKHGKAELFSICETTDDDLEAQNKIYKLVVDTLVIDKALLGVPEYYAKLGFWSAVKLAEPPEELSIKSGLANQ